MCTDVMGRGVDIPDISWVIQYDPPTYARFTTFLYLYSMFSVYCSDVHLALFVIQLIGGQ